MSDVRRWNLVNGEMKIDPNGRWVHFEDHLDDALDASERAHMTGQMRAWATAMSRLTGVAKEEIVYALDFAPPDMKEKIAEMLSRLDERQP